MKKTISRDLVFTRKEVRDLMLRQLAADDHPTPRQWDDAAFTLSENGAALSWTEVEEDAR